jgi:hypothetical protein
LIREKELEMQKSHKHESKTQILTQIGLTDVEIENLDTVPNDPNKYLDMIFVRNNLNHSVVLIVHGKTRNVFNPVGSNSVVCFYIESELETRHTTIEFKHQSNSIGKPIVAHLGKLYNIGDVVTKEHSAYSRTSKICHD